MLKSFAVSLFAFVILVPWAARITAQEAPAKHFTMQQIVFKGTRVLRDKQLLSALGMKIGGSYTQQDLVDAANKLANSGRPRCRIALARIRRNSTWSTPRVCCQSVLTIVCG